MARYSVEILLDAPDSDYSEVLDEQEVEADNEDEAVQKALDASGFAIGWTVVNLDDDDEEEEEA